MLKTAEALLLAHGSALLALVLGAIGGLFAGSARKRAGWRAALSGGTPWGAAALAGGWALLAGWPLHLAAVWTPHRGLETLLAPAIASLLVACVLAWSARRRLLLGADAVFAGWWIASANVGSAAFWRVWFVVTLLGVLLPRITGPRPAGAIGLSSAPALSIALALWGGSIVAGTGAGWQAAALVAAGAALGSALTGGAGSPGGGALPAATVVALLGAADLAGGRMLRGGFGAVDAACVGAVLAPMVAGVLEGMLKRRFTRRLPVAAVSILAALLAAGALSAAAWGLKRGGLT